MTAEVIVLNREAVAIAADSAATRHDPDPKIYNTANKLFQLSAVEPVAVMIYGTASFASIPWETVIKEFRQTLGKQRLGTVEQYAAEFIKSLASLIPHVPDELQQDITRRLVAVEISGIMDQMKSVVDATSDADELLTSDDSQNALLELMAERMSVLDDMRCESAISASVAGMQIARAIPSWDEYLSDAIPDITINAVISRRARALARTSLRTVYQSPWSSGVVVVGFGSEQLFPAYSHYVADGVVANHVRARSLSAVDLADGAAAQISAFAQQDMVHTFMNGLHPDYPEALHGLVERLLSRFVGELRKLSESLPDIDTLRSHVQDMENVSISVLEDFEERLVSLLKERHSDPIMSIVSTLPKEGLAEMAENLVSLTSFKRRMTPTAETVGGPVDVAVISKGDGLVWIKRKHYFDKELNMRYFSRQRDLFDDPSI